MRMLLKTALDVDSRRSVDKLGAGVAQDYKLDAQAINVGISLKIGGGNCHSPLSAPVSLIGTAIRAHGAHEAKAASSADGLGTGSRCGVSHGRVTLEAHGLWG